MGRVVRETASVNAFEQMCEWREGRREPADECRRAFLAEGRASVVILEQK